MALSERQKKHLRRLGHDLHPVVRVGQRGINPGVLEELEIALDHHELVKLRARAGSRDTRDDILEQLANQTGAELVHRIGNVALFYRKNKKLQKVLLPDS
jgi:RNA-binding protein